uniref:Uncharacterized protein n=1 Tax=Heterorhabditis bacteriophora TaxID=37862 RepID=A0A1I7WUL1_HETBA
MMNTFLCDVYVLLYRNAVYICIFNYHNYFNFF